MGKISKRIRNLENIIKTLQDKVLDLTIKVENKRIPPETVTPKLNLSRQGIIPSTGTGLGKVHGMQGNIIWNDSEAGSPPFGIQPPTPNKGYNKHSHSKFSGGALDIHTLQLVEYVTDNPDAEDPVILDAYGQPVNKHTQSYWNNHPKVVKDGNVEKIGMLDISFDSSSKKWVTGSKEVDVKKTYFVQYVWMLNNQEVPEGTLNAIKEIKKDENDNEMKSPLLYDLGDTSTVAGRNENLNKSNIYWDKDAQSWRIYAVFKPYPE